MFEVQDLRYATLATVSRCGMVWFSEDVLSTEMIFDNNLLRMKRVPIEEFEEETRRIKARGEEENALSPAMQVWKIKALYEGEILILFLSLNSQPKEPFAPKIPQFPEPKCQWNNSGEMYFSPHANAYLRDWYILSPQSSLVVKGSLSNDDGDVNENGKKGIG